MKIDGLKLPKSSFLSMEKDMGIIIDKMMKNERLKRLLHYTTKDALVRGNITEDESLDLIGKNIKIVPKLYVDGSVLNYIIISFDNFTANSNPEFRDNIIEFDVICHFDQWQLQDFQLRPYKIAAEIDSMFNDTHLTGIGHLEFLGANQMILTDEYAGLCLMYRAVHGEEDKKFMPNPADEERFLEDFEDFIQ
jgi:hypothetical protein